MSQGKDQNVRGEILLSPPMVVEWKVTSFFSLSKELGYHFDSPTFPFLEGMWYIQCFPNGQTRTKSGWMDLYLMRKSSSSIHTIAYHLGIRSADGIEYASGAPFTAEFKVGGYGAIHIAERSALVKDKRFVAPRDEITIFCILRLRPNKDATSQTVSSEGIDVSTKTSEEDFENIEDEQVSVPGGTDKLAQSLKEGFLSGEYHDTVIKVKDEEFRAHKFILVFRSPVFASMFRHNTIECSTGVVTIEDCDPNAFREFLSYLYSGKVENLSTENVLNLYFIGDKYEVEEVKAVCVKYMINNISIDNFCDFISLALRHGEKGLIKSATDYFIKNVKTIIVTSSWQCFHKDNPIESNELHIKAITHLIPD